jgi:transcriptional regulator of acetoin/glycerol metabolism
MNPSPTLSPSLVARLREAHAMRRENEIPLLALVHALRATGWSLQAIAEPLGVTREIVRVWNKKAEDLTDLPRLTVEAAPSHISKETERNESVAMRRLIRDQREKAVLDAHLPRLRELKPLAEALRGPSRFDPTKASASLEYTTLLNETLAAGVRTRVLAEALGIKEITIHARLRRGGFRKTSPSEQVPQWAQPTWGVSA